MRFFSGGAETEAFFSLATALKADVSVKGSEIILEGRCPVCYAPFGQTHAAEGKKHYFNDRGIPYAAVLRVYSDTVFGSDTGITASGKDITAVFTAVTGFVDYKTPPGDGGGLVEKCLSVIEKYETDGYERVKSGHIMDYRSLYSGVTFRLPEGEISNLPCDIRLKRHSEGIPDPSLCSLLFNYGRYLVISASRKGSQPMNLQGIWNDKTSPPWSSNYTLNINTEMNYWPVLKTGLTECIFPLLEMTKELRSASRKTAQDYYGAPGAVSHHATDIWRTAHPSNNLIPDSAKWSFWNMSLGWMSSYFVRYYEYTLDRSLLRETFGLLCDCADFYMFLMVKDENGRLIVSPSTSPENSFVFDDGEPCAVSLTTEMTMAVTREVFRNLIEISELLSEENETVKKGETAFSAS